jgi:hypothetical protein
MTAPIASGWSGCRVGLAPTGKRRLVTAHANAGHTFHSSRRGWFKKFRQRRFERTVTPLAEGSLDGLFNLLFKSSVEIGHLVAERQFQMRVTKDQGDEC